jgi:hypothetical protein
VACGVKPVAAGKDGCQTRIYGAVVRVHGFSMHGYARDVGYGVQGAGWIVA